MLSTMRLASSSSPTSSSPPTSSSSSPPRTTTISPPLPLPPPSSIIPHHRAKVYRLSEEDSQWRDDGIGLVRCGFVDEVNATAIILRSEEQPEVILLECVVRPEGDFKRSVPTIISWTETTPSIMVSNVALSFEEERGCNEIWDEICRIQNSCVIRDSHHRRFILAGGGGDSTTIDGINSPRTSSPNNPYGSGMNTNSPPPHLSKLTRDNVETVLEELHMGGAALIRERTVTSLLSDDPDASHLTLNNLLQVFSSLENELPTCSDPVAIKHTITRLFEVMKCCSLMDDTRLFDYLLSEDKFMLVAGLFEYDPTMPFNPEHRKFLSEKASLKEVVPITNPAIRGMIIQRFRLQFIRDVLLPRILDELAFKKLAMMDAQLSADIASALHQDATFLPDLFILLRATSIEMREPATIFLAELATLAQKMPPTNRNAFFQTLVREDRLNFFSVAECILNDDVHSTARERLNIAEVVLSVLRQDPTLLRNHIHAQESVSTTGLLPCIVRLIVHDSDCGVQADACDILMTLLDPEYMEVVEKERFVQNFHSKYLAEVLKGLDVGDGTNPTETQCTAAHLVCSLLSFCVQSHDYVIRYSILHSDLVTRVLALLACSEKHLVLDAIKFIRTCISTREVFFSSYFVKNDSFQPIIDMFCRNGVNRDNLVNSAVLDLLDLIKQINHVELVKYVVENFTQQLSPTMSYVGTFKELMELNNGNGGGNGVTNDWNTSLFLFGGGGGNGNGGDASPHYQIHGVHDVGMQPSMGSPSSSTSSSSPRSIGFTNREVDMELELPPSPPIGSSLLVANHHNNNASNNTTSSPPMRSRLVMKRVLVDSRPPKIPRELSTSPPPSSSSSSHHVEERMVEEGGSM